MQRPLARLFGVESGRAIEARALPDRGTSNSASRSTWLDPASRQDLLRASQQTLQERNECLRYCGRPPDGSWDCSLRIGRVAAIFIGFLHT